MLHSTIIEYRTLVGDATVVNISCFTVWYISLHGPVAINREKYHNKKTQMNTQKKDRN